MNTCTNSKVRSLTPDEIELISGGATPTEQYAFTSGNTNYYKFTCPTGYALTGIQFGSTVEVVAGNIYSGGFGCAAGDGYGDYESAIAYQQGGSGGWTDYSVSMWGID